MRREFRSVEHVNRARPDEVAVLLREADVHRVVSRFFERNVSRQVQAAVRVFVGQAEHADAAADAAGLEDQIIQADIGDGDLAFDQRGIDAKRAQLRIHQPSVEPTKPAGGQGLPIERRRPRLRQFFVEVH